MDLKCLFKALIQASKLQGEIQKSIWKVGKKTKVQRFSEGKNYNRKKHCEWHIQIKNEGET